MSTKNVPPPLNFGTECTFETTLINSPNDQLSPSPIDRETKELTQCFAKEFFSNPGTFRWPSPNDFRTATPNDFRTATPNDFRTATPNDLKPNTPNDKFRPLTPNDRISMISKQCLQAAQRVN